MVKSYSLVLVSVFSSLKYSFCDIPFVMHLQSNSASTLAFFFFFFLFSYFK